MYTPESDREIFTIRLEGFHQHLVKWRAIKVLVVFAMLLVSTSVLGSALTDIRRATEYLQKLYPLYISTMDIYLDIDRAEALIDDYRHGAINENVLKREVVGTIATIESRLEQLIARIDRTDLSVPPLENQNYLENLHSFGRHVTEFPELVRQKSENARALLLAAISRDDEQYDLLSARSYRLTARMLEVENLMLASNLIAADPSHPNTGYVRSVRASNQAMVLVLEMFAKVFESDYELERTRFDEARNALARAERALADASVATRNVEVEMNGLPTAGQRDEAVKAIVSDIVENYFRAIAVEREVNMLMRDWIRDMERGIDDLVFLESEEFDLSALRFQIEIEDAVNRRMGLQQERLDLVQRMGRLEE